MPATADLMASLGLDKSGFSSNIKAAQNEATDFGKLAGKIGGQLAGLFAVGSVVRFIGAQAEAAEATLATSHALGLTAETFQALTKAADMNASSEEAMSRGLAHLQKALGEAKSGSESALAAFSALGVSGQQIASMDLAGAVQAVATAWSAGAGDASTYANVQELLGRGAIDLNATFELIAKKTLPGMAEEMKAAGQIISSDVIASLSKLDDVTDDIMAKVSRKAATGVGMFFGGLGILLGGEIDFGYTDPDQRMTTPEERKASAEAAAKKRYKASIQRTKRDDEIDAAQKAAAEAEEKANLNRLSSVQRVAFYEREIQRLREINQGTDTLEAAKAGAKLYELEEKLTKEREAVAKREEDATKRRLETEEKIANLKAQTQARIAGLFGRETDPNNTRPVADLNRIGGFVGGMRDTRQEYQAGILRANEQAVRLLADALRQLAEINRKTTKGPAQV